MICLHALRRGLVPFILAMVATSGLASNSLSCREVQRMVDLEIVVDWLARAHGTVAVGQTAHAALRDSFPPDASVSHHYRDTVETLRDSVRAMKNGAHPTTPFTTQFKAAIQNLKRINASSDCFQGRGEIDQRQNSEQGATSPSLVVNNAPKVKSTDARDDGPKPMSIGASVAAFVAFAWAAGAYMVRRELRSNAKRHTFACRLTVRNEAGGRRIFGRSMDISRSGMRVSAENEFKKDDVVLLSLLSTELEAKVVWRSDTHFGVQFTRILSKRKLDALMRANKAIPSMWKLVLEEQM